MIVETSESTISRELKRNTGWRGYRPKQAQNKTSRRKRNAAKAIKMTAEVIVLVNRHLSKITTIQTMKVIFDYNWLVTVKPMVVLNK